jgi:hypothetical protein
VAGSRGEACVTRDQWHCEDLGERDKGGVICREVVAKSPYAIAERLVGVTHELQIGEFTARV